jgi:hypothetical protein
MALDAADWTVATNGDIRWTGGGSQTNVAVIELHRFLQDLADDAVASGDDLLDITNQTPSDRSTDNIVALINGFNVDDTAAEHIFDGSIIQDGGDTIYDGIVNFGNATHIEVLQNGALIVNDFWNLGGSGLNADLVAGISHRFIVKVRSGGVDIDGRRLLGISREFGFTYSEFGINGTSRGNNVLALSQANDLNNQTAVGTVATWTDIVNGNEGYSAIDVTGDTVDEFYYSEWDKAARTINQFYERGKWLTRRGSSSTLYGLNGQIFRGITHDVTVDTPSGTFQEPEPISWTGGTGQLLAINSTTTPTRLWMQLLTGVAPTDGQTITGGTSSATCVVNVTVTSRPVPNTAFGQSTGSAIIGAYGLGIQASDLTASDTLFDLDNVAQLPPNNVQFTVSGLVNGEDRVLVGPATGGVLDTGQFLLNAGVSSGAATIVVKDGTEAAGTGESIATDAPTTGTIRVQGDDGVFYRVTYTGVSHAAGTTTFTGCSGLGDDAAVDNAVYVSYIDELASGTSASFTVVYAADRNLFVRVRDGGGTPIRTFETPSTLTSAGGSATAIRTSDA